MNSHYRMTIHDATTGIARVKTLFKAAQIVFPILCVLCPSLALATGAFTLSAYGPNNVVVGNDLYIQETPTMTVDTLDYAYYYVDGLPAGATASWPYILTTCCPTLTTTPPTNLNRGYRPSITELLKINVPSTVPTGTYNLTLRIQSGGITQTLPYTMTVNPVPGSLPKQVISSIPPIPSLSTWQSNMTTYGQKLCNSATITSLGTWDGNIWFYDGIRVYYQIADYTGDPTWNACAGYVESVYKPYVLSNGGGVQAYFVFPHGLYQAYSRNHSDVDAQTAAIDLVTNSPYAKKGGGVSFGVTGLQRETAYLVSAYRIAGLLGSPQPVLYAQSVNFVLGMIDQMFVSNTDPYLKPFVVGLMMEALIQYYQDPNAPVLNDPRVPPAIKAAADALWARAWMPASNAFYYQSTDSPLAASPDLNLLIAPAYAWLYKMTGNPVYQQEGDLIFQGGVSGSWLTGGKQFSQSYRWSFDYVNWRSHPDITPPAAPTSLKIIQ